MTKHYETGFYKDGAQVQDESQARQLGALLAAGSSMSAAARELGISANKAKRLSNSDKCKRAMIEVGAGAVEAARVRVKAATADMVEGIIDTLKSHLKDKNLNAVPIALKVLGFGEEQGDTRPTTFTIVMPGAEAPTDITPEYSEVSDVPTE